LLPFSSDFFSRLLCKNLNIKIYKTIILLVFLVWSLTLKEEHNLRVFENRVLKRIFGPKRSGVAGGWTVWSFITCTPTVITRTS
jgi:hypothetical protein